MVILTQKKWDALEQQMKAMQSQNMAALVNNINTRIFPNFSVVKEMDAYQTMDQIYSIVKKLATNSALIPFYGYNAKGEDLPDNDPLTLFLESLDFEQKEILYTYLYYTGEVWMIKNRYELGVNQGRVSGFSFEHRDNMSLEVTKERPKRITGYYYADPQTGESFRYDIEDVIFIKLPNPSKDPIEAMRGLSPMKVLARALTRLQSGEDISVAQLQNGGGKDIVYDKTPGLDTTALGSRKENYSKFIRNPSNYGAPYFAGGEMGVISLGSTLTDMEVLALSTVDFDRLCNGFGISSVLFNDKSSSTYNNVRGFLGEAYTNVMIPNVGRVEAALNKGLLTLGMEDIKTKPGAKIKADVSDIDALKLDRVQLLAMLQNAWWLTGNEKRVEDGYDKDTENELMDKYLVPANLVPLEDLGMVAPVDNTANDYQPNQANRGNQATVVPLKNGTNG